MQKHKAPGRQEANTDMSEVARIVRREFIYLWYYFDIQLRQIFWYWVLGIAIGSFISVFAKNGIHDLFRRMQGKKWGLFGIIPACLLGIASPLSCTAPSRSPRPFPDRACAMTGLPRS